MSTPWDFPSYVSSVYIYLAAPPIILSVGIVGNAMAAVVLLQRTMRSSTSSMYLIALAFVDTIVLLTGLVREWIKYGISPYREHFGYWMMKPSDVRDYTDAGCKLHMFILYTTIHISAWLLVCLAVDRVIAVFIPHKSKLLCTHNVTLGAIGVTVLVCIALNAHFFVTVKLNTRSGYSWCATNGDKNSTNAKWKKTYQIIDAVVASYAPFVIMLSANLMIIGKLMLIKYKRGQMVSYSSSNDSKLNTMTAILLTVNFVFFVTTCPIVVLKKYYTVWFDLNTWEGYMNNELAFAICNILFYLNSALNFLLYCISGPRFRREFMVLVRRCQGRARVAPEELSMNGASTRQTQLHSQTVFSVADK
ncbi:unnamed protein product [Owenia fusiformis]|uniref:Uncharacterized protein n=1 Tax=Owenia fusiformis TaxID=6347 RepID=A0A8J1TZW3_OWEFU|nr:unnamed protein product [Owenia fusiformis]